MSKKVLLFLKPAAREGHWTFILKSLGDCAVQRQTLVMPGLAGKSAARLIASLL
jgi:hypothetical protein